MRSIRLDALEEALGDHVALDLVDAAIETVDLESLFEESLAAEGEAWH